jgi:hypothetical protein
MFKKICLEINAFLSGGSEQSAIASGLNQCGLQLNPFLMILTAVGTTRYK